MVHAGLLLAVLSVGPSLGATEGAFLRQAGPEQQWAAFREREYAFFAVGSFFVGESFRISHLRPKLCKTIELGGHGGRLRD